MLRSLDPRPRKASCHLLFDFSLSPPQAHNDFHPDIIQKGLHKSRSIFAFFHFSHLWLLWFTLAMPFPPHEISLPKNTARLQRRHLSLYFLLWVRSGNVSSGLLNSDLSAKMFTAFNPPSRMLRVKVTVGSLLSTVPCNSQGLQWNLCGISDIWLLIILGGLVPQELQMALC